MIPADKKESPMVKSQEGDAKKIGKREAKTVKKVQKGYT